MIVLAVPTYRAFDCLKECIQSAFDGELAPDCVLIIDNSGGRAYPYIQTFDRIVYLPMPYNLGVARSWNLAFSLFGNETLIISNDDVRFHKDTIRVMVEHKDAADFIYPTIKPENMFSLFLMSYYTWLHVGPFDQNFYPAYFEDNDYHRRMKLHGVRELCVNTTYSHVGSATIKTYTPEEMEFHHESFRRNERYYKQKWGLD